MNSLRENPRDLFEDMGKEMNRKRILIGSAAAGILAIVCALALANRMKKSEKKQ
jgi:hypothetical protein